MAFIITSRNVSQFLWYCRIVFTLIYTWYETSRWHI